MKHRGKVREIRLYGDPVLRSKATRVESIDDRVLQLAADLTETMLSRDGLGLAANQIGELSAVIVLNPRAAGGQQDILVLINPEIIEAQGTIEREEACLSLPGISEVISRPARTLVRAISLTGKQFELPVQGLLARALLHEIDHLNGILFIDYLPPLRRRLLTGRLKELEDASRLTLAGQTQIRPSCA